MKKVLVVCAMLALAGCASTGALRDSDLVQGYGVMKLTEQSVKGDAEKAAKVRAIAEDVQRLADDTSFDSVMLLMEAVRAKIPWSDLSPADTFFANEVLRLWQEDLSNQYGGGVLPDDLRLSIRKVAGWVMLAAQP